MWVLSQTLRQEYVTGWQYGLPGKQGYGAVYNPGSCRENSNKGLQE